MKPNKTKTSCPSCGVKWIEHKGLEYTCRDLKVAINTLEQIAHTPRNKGARINALATLDFLKIFK